VTRADDVRRVVEHHAPWAIVNCVGYNHVDRAEEEAELALSVNALAVRTLARAAADVGAALVHYSSDFVFDGETDRPYTEEDQPQPRSVYAASKLLGEWFAADAPSHYVLRVESLFGGLDKRTSSFDKIVETVAAGGTVRVFVDRVVSPSYVWDVADATMHLLASGAAPGVYHCVNSGAATWHEVARKSCGSLARRPRSSRYGSRT
jgi:dTDP-4-dehydrorhamnose reductase